VGLSASPHRASTFVNTVVPLLGVDAPCAGHAALHDLMVTRDYHDQLPREARDHLVCRIVDELTPITQKHGTEGIVMGVEPPAMGQ
jgi:hypothetical protein